MRDLWARFCEARARFHAMRAIGAMGRLDYDDAAACLRRANRWRRRA
jgi:hypothetical protein